MASPARTQVFVSYSHADAEWLRRLEISLRPFTRNHPLEVWADTRIQAGSKWREEIRHAIATARVAVLLVTPDFLASDFIVNDELPPLLKRAEEDGLTILWVAVRHSSYRETAIEAYQAANSPARPLAALPTWEQDEEFVKIAQQIRDAATRPIDRRPVSSPVSISPQIVGESLLPKQPFEPEMILIPAGEFLMGSDPQRDEGAYDVEQPQHRLHLPAYYLAKTPVTNGQYRAFVAATGRVAPVGWTNKAPARGEEDHPVVIVNWYDARDYCQWLSEVTGRRYALPSEAEWEKGARGIDGRIYPWGNQWDATRCNSEASVLGKITSVHAYPQGASPYGVLDMAGNVTVWTRSLWGKSMERPDYRYPYRPIDGRENLDAGREVARVLRGGAFDVNRRFVRCAFRGKVYPGAVGLSLGFRVVVLPAS